MPISDRALALAGLLLLAACGRGGGERAAEPAAGAADVPKVACAVGGAALATACGVERIGSGDGMGLILRHPDGGFRRLRVTGDGRGVIAADGAERAQVRIVGEREIEVRLGGDVYRLPATLRGGPLTAK